MESIETVTPSPVSPPAPEPKTSYGAVIALILIVLLIASAALYYLRTRLSDVSVIHADPSALTEQGESTEPSAIESDLSAKSPDEFDQDLEEAFVELDTAFDSE